MSYKTAMARVLLLAALGASLVWTQEQSSAPATLTIKGDIPATLTLSAGDLAKMPRQTVSVTDSDGSKIDYEGVLLRDILKQAGAPLALDRSVLPCRDLAGLAPQRQ